MTEPNFRALCAELAKQLEGWQCYASPDGPNADVLARARAALAQPEPQGPSDSLVDRVADALMESIKGQAPMARAAIREVAAWLREQHDGDLVAATVLEREAGR